MMMMVEETGRVRKKKRSKEKSSAKVGWMGESQKMMTNKDFNKKNKVSVRYLNRWHRRRGERTAATMICRLIKLIESLEQIALRQLKREIKTNATTAALRIQQTNRNSWPSKGRRP